MKANRSVCRNFVVIIQPQRWSCRKHVSIINRNGSHAESTLSLFDLNVGFTTNMLPISNRNVSPTASTLPIINRNGSFTTNILSISNHNGSSTASMFADIRPQGLRALHPVFGKCVKQLSTLHRGLGIGSGQTLAPFALSERKAKYPNKDQNTPAQENDRIFRVYRKNGQRNPNNHRPRGAIFFFVQLFISPKTVLPSSCDT